QRRHLGGASLALVGPLLEQCRDLVLARERLQGFSRCGEVGGCGVRKGCRCDERCKQHGSCDVARSHGSPRRAGSACYKRRMTKRGVKREGEIRVGVGGWTYEPWRT